MDDDHASKHHRHLDTEAEVKRLRDEVNRLRSEMDGVLSWINRFREGARRLTQKSEDGR